MSINYATLVAPNEATSSYNNLVETLNSLTNPQDGYATQAVGATATLVAASITLARDSVYMGITPSAASALTLDTVALVAAALQAAVGPNVNIAGMSWVLRIINIGAGGTITVTTSAGWTLTGTLTCAANTWRDFLVTMTSATTATMQSVGVGTIS